LNASFARRFQRTDILLIIDTPGVRSRLTHVTEWLKVREPDVLLLQELKGTEFPSESFKSLGYESVAVTQKTYNGVAILSRHPMKTIANALVGTNPTVMRGSWR
jgi:exonuclease III